jgi:RHS repeat-associated protein
LRTIDNWIPEGEVSPDLQDNGAWLFAPEHNGPANDQNRIVIYDYDAAGRKTTVIDPMGNTTATTYRLDGRVDTVTDPENTISLYRYDKRGRRILVVQGYTANGEDPGLWQWDNIQKRWEKSDGTTTIDHNTPANDQNVIVQVHYDLAGRMLNRRDPRGSLTTYAYDKLGRRTTLNMPKTDSEILTWTTAYTEQDGLPRTTLTDPMTYQTQRRFDRLGRVNEINYLNESPKLTPDVAFSYDLAGNRALMTEYDDANHSPQTQSRVTHYGYNDARRLIQVDFDTDGDGTINETVSYEYDAGGLRTKLTMPGDLHVTYTYDTKGRLIQLTDWDNHTTRFAYDSASRMVSTQRHNGFRSRYGYDAAGHLRHLHHAEDAKTFAHFEYEVDGRGNRIRAREALAHPAATNETTYLYNDKSLILRGDWLPLVPFQVATRRSATLQLSFFGSYATLTMGTGPDHSIFDIYVNHALWRSFDGYAVAAGEREIEILLESDGSHTLEIRNRAEKHLDSSAYKLRFKQLVVPDCTYDLHTIEYAYDALSRVTEARYNPGLNTAVENADLLRRYQYGYDLAGNRVQEIETIAGTPTTTNYTYNAANQISNTGFAYDANGNLTNNGTKEYAWDRASRLLSMGGISYAYDGLGSRTHQTVHSIVTNYLLDVQPGLVKMLGATTGPDAQHYVFGPRGILAGEDSTGNWIWMVQDGLGSVRIEVGDTLGVLASQNYKPYGHEFGTQGNFGLPFGFTGEPGDGNGLVYLRARYVNPILGVFTGLDSLEGNIQELMSLNRYSWVEGNVSNRIDPSGQQLTATDCEGDELNGDTLLRCYLARQLLSAYPESRNLDYWLRFSVTGLIHAGSIHLERIRNGMGKLGDNLAIVPLDYQPVTGENARPAEFQMQSVERLRWMEAELDRPLTFVEILATIFRRELNDLLNAKKLPTSECGLETEQFQNLTRQAVLRFFHGQCRRDGRFGDSINPDEGLITGECGPGRLIGTTMSNVESFYDAITLPIDYQDWIDDARNIIVNSPQPSGYQCATVEGTYNSPFMWGNFTDEPTIGVNSVMDYINYDTGGTRDLNYFAIQFASGCTPDFHRCAHASAYGVQNATSCIPSILLKFNALC